MSSEPTRKLSAIIACYRDAQAVPIMHERLTAVFNKLGVDYEIIFVNDNSPDNAREVLAALAARDPRVVVINHSRNFGSQSAFTSGMRIATGDAVILLDGDLQDPPELIESFYQKWLEGYDVVYGERVQREATWFLQIAYKAFYRLFRSASYVPIPLDAGDFSLIARRVVDALNSLPENNRFMRGLRAWVGYRQTGVPYVRPERMFGHTTNSEARSAEAAPIVEPGDGTRRHSRLRTDVRDQDPGLRARDHGRVGQVRPPRCTVPRPAIRGGSADPGGV